MYTINFTPEAWRKYRGYIQLVDNEVSGLGRIKFDPFTDSIVVDDIILFPQTVSGASTTMDRDGLDKWLLDCMDKGIDTSQYRLWWHSHANMSVFWSGTDTATIKDWDNEQQADNYFVSVVGNRKGDIKARIDVFAPFKYTFEDVECGVLEPEDDLSDLKAEVAAKVNTYKPKPLPGGRNKEGSLKPVIVDRYKESGGILVPDEDVEKKIMRLPEAEQIRGWYYSEYLAGRWDRITDPKDLEGFGDLSNFMTYFDRTKNQTIWIPKAPECKWYKKFILEQVNRELDIQTYHEKFDN